LLTGSIPAQSCEYFTDRLFSGYHITSPTGSSKRILDRLKLASTNVNLLELIHNTAAKYGAPIMTTQNSRKAAMLFRKALQGTVVNVSSFTGSLSVAERLSLILLGILYTFRNDRFHGDLHPPFKSSLATLQTYTHAHFSFLVTYFLFLQTLHFSNKVPFKSDNIDQNITSNIQIFTQLYGKHITRSVLKNGILRPDALAHGGSNGFDKRTMGGDRSLDCAPPATGGWERASAA
jgi:hypothetical protein